VLYIVLLASTGFLSQETRGTFFLQNIENQWCHCDYWLRWWIGLRLFMEFAHDGSWWFSPLHRMTTNNGVLQDEVCQHLISLTGGKRDHFSAKYWKSMMSLWLLIALMDRVKVIHGVLHMMAPDGFHHFIEWQRIMVFYKMRFASTWFHSQEARGTIFLQNIVNQCCHCDYWLHWWIGLRLYMEFPQDATWWISPLFRMTGNKMCYILYC
jgi:hypothetical protein